VAFTVAYLAADDDRHGRGVGISGTARPAESWYSRCYCPSWRLPRVFSATVRVAKIFLAWDLRCWLDTRMPMREVRLPPTEPRQRRAKGKRARRSAWQFCQYNAWVSDLSQPGCWTCKLRSLGEPGEIDNKWQKTCQITRHRPTGAVTSEIFNRISRQHLIYQTRP
jgi:hypothetical protein